jgi:hypothetical protein
VNRILDMLWRVLALAVLVPLAIVALALCGCGPKCPTCPKPIPPPPVVVVKSPPPCTLPELPAPLPQIGVPDPQRGGYFVPNASWALLGGYQSGIREWIVAAAKCITAGRSAP